MDIDKFMSATNAGRNTQRARKSCGVTVPAKKRRGRPTVPTDQRRDRTVRARVTAADEAKFNRLGGANWLRAAIKRAKEKES